MKERKDMAPFMKNVVFFALFANLFILVSADSRCADNSLSHSRQYKSTKNYVCCADGECHPKTCFNIFCLQDKDCTNQRDKLICCGNRCVFGSNFARRSCSLDSDPTWRARVKITPREKRRHACRCVRVAFSRVG